MEKLTCSLGSVADPNLVSGGFLTPGSGIRIRDEPPRSYFRELRNNFALKYSNSLMRIRDPGWKKFRSGIKKNPGPQHCVSFRFLTLVSSFAGWNREDGRVLGRSLRQESTGEGQLRGLLQVEANKEQKKFSRKYFGVMTRDSVHMFAPIPKSHCSYISSSA